MLHTLEKPATSRRSETLPLLKDKVYPANQSMERLEADGLENSGHNNILRLDLGDNGKDFLVTTYQAVPLGSASR